MISKNRLFLLALLLMFNQALLEAQSLFVVAPCDLQLKKSLDSDQLELIGTDANSTWKECIYKRRNELDSGVTTKQPVSQKSSNSSQSLMLAIPGLSNGSGPISQVFSEHIGQRGYDIVGLGDVNGDGYADWAHSGGNYGRDRGTISIISGRDHALISSFSGQEEGQNFGVRLIPAGDFDRDGVSDLLVASFPTNSRQNPTRERVEVISTVTGQVLATINSPTVGKVFGLSLAYLGDPEQDGVPNYAIGEPLYNSNLKGRVHFYNGARKIGSRTGDYADLFYGTEVQSVGDMNGDGFDDIAVVASGVGPAQIHLAHIGIAGFVDVLSGNPASFGDRIFVIANRGVQIGANHPLVRLGYLPSHATVYPELRSVVDIVIPKKNEKESS